MDFKYLARKGVFYLEESVLGILLDAKESGKFVNEGDIAKRAGLFKTCIVRGILEKLEKNNRVQRHCNQNNYNGFWMISDEELDLR